jgi:LEA14-like dessication related protein
MNRSLSTGRLVGVVGVVAILLLAIAAYGLIVVDTPRVQSVDNSWGTVTTEQTEIESEIQVENPLLVRVGDAAADVRYTVALNGITVATEREQEVSLGGQEDVIMVSTWMDNNEIPD